MQKRKTSDLVQMAMFVAIIILLAFTPIGYIPLGVTRATIIHVPAIIGSIMLGPFAGAFLGAVFGITSLISNTINPTVTSFVFSPFITIGGASGNFMSLVICMVPRILVGVVPYYVYHGLKKVIKNDAVDLTIAGVAGSMTNTILVMGGIYVFFGQAYAAAREIDFSALFGVIMGVIGINGVPEAILAGILTMAVCKVLLRYVKPATQTADALPETAEQKPENTQPETSAPKENGDTTEGKQDDVKPEESEQKEDREKTEEKQDSAKDAD